MRSVILQGYPNLEYIVIDGGSSDNSVDIIKKYSDKIAYWVSEPDGGHGKGLNKGFRKSSGEIMGWINSDDMLTPWSLRTVAEIFTKFPHVSWIQGFTSMWSRHGQMLSASRNLKNLYDFLIGDYAWIQQESVFWRRSLWDRSGGEISEKVKLMVDGELWSRFFLHDELYSVDCILGGYGLTGENRAQLNLQACHQEMEELIPRMRNKCDAKTINDARRLGEYRKMLSFSPSQRIKAEELFEDTGYKLIFWDLSIDAWSEKKVPFRSFPN